jgi:hypothetical protein
MSNKTLGLTTRVRSLAFIAAAVAGLTALATRPAVAQNNLDLTSPLCSLTQIDTGPPFQQAYTIQDTGSGLASIIVTQANNADVPVPPYTVGTTDPVLVTATSIDQSHLENFAVSFSISDVAGNITECSFNADSQIQATVPEPGMVTMLFGSGIGGGVLLLRRRRA